MSTLKAKRNQLLSDISGAVLGQRTSKVVPVLGHDFTLLLPLPEGEDWVANHTPGTTITAALLNSRKPSLAVAIQAIDGVSVEQLFEFPDDMEPKEKKEILDNPELFKSWLRTQVLMWLSDEVDTVMVDQLHEAYSEMVRDHKKTMEAVPNFSKRTPSAA